MSASLQIDEATLRAVVDEVLRGLGRAPAVAAPVAATPAAPAIVSPKREGRFGVSAMSPPLVQPPTVPTCSSARGVSPAAPG